MSCVASSQDWLLSLARYRCSQITVVLLSSGGSQILLLSLPEEIKLSCVFVARKEQDPCCCGFFSVRAGEPCLCHGEPDWLVFARSQAVLLSRQELDWLVSARSQISLSSQERDWLVVSPGAILFCLPREDWD